MKALLLLVVMCICCWHGNAYKSDGSVRLRERSPFHEDDHPEDDETEHLMDERMDEEADDSMDREAQDSMEEDTEDPMDEDPVASKSCEQTGCKHGGTCDSRTGQCSCAMGFSGWVSKFTLQIIFHGSGGTVMVGNVTMQF